LFVERIHSPLALARQSTYHGERELGQTLFQVLHDYLLFFPEQELPEDCLKVHECKELLEVELAGAQQVHQFLQAADVLLASTDFSRLHDLQNVEFSHTVLLVIRDEGVEQHAHSEQPLDLGERGFVGLVDVSHLVDQRPLFEFLGRRQCKTSLAQVI